MVSNSGGKACSTASTACSAWPFGTNAPKNCSSPGCHGDQARVLFLDNGRLFFGSEIRAVRAGLRQKTDVDPVALNLFLRYRYTPSPLTVFRGIRKLAPGEMLTVQDGQVKTTRWYRFEPKLYDPMPKPADAIEHLLELYKRAVKRHLISDVPLGLLLSGGIDSGLLLGLMGLFGKDWPTFTVGYGSSFKDDELVDAAETARIFSAEKRRRQA